MISAKETIEKNNLISKGDIIGCAVSGGSDSMALLHFLLSLQNKYSFKLVCVNVEHGIRGAESVSDSCFVKKFCENNKIELYFKAVESKAYAKQNNCNLEQAARGLRYDFFYSLIKNGKCNKIFTAHNKNDNAETVFLNILRGSGSAGLCGMDINNNKGIIRPMLFTEKQEVLDYVEKNNILYRTDSTNNDNAYSRNYLRNCIFPLLEKKFDGLYDNINRLSGIIKTESSYLDDISRKFIKTDEDGCYITLPCDDVILKRAAFICCRMLGAEKDIFSVNICDIAALAKKQNGSMVNLTKNINVYKEYERLYFENGTKTPKKQIALPFSLGEHNIGGYNITIKNISLKQMSMEIGQTNVFFADSKKINVAAMFRGRQTGDSFKRFKGGRKSLSDFLTDSKVPKRQRDNILLLCDQSNVLIAFPYDICDDIKVDQNSKDILKINYRRIN